MASLRREAVEACLSEPELRGLAATCDSLHLALERWPRITWLRAYAVNAAAYRRVRQMEAEGVSREIAIGRTAAELGVGFAGLKARLIRDMHRRAEPTPQDVTDRNAGTRRAG